MEFTLKTYTCLIEAFKKAGYRFVTFEDYCEHDAEYDDAHFVIMRHDVDKRAYNALVIAKMEAKSGIQSSFYFRVDEQSNQPEVIKAIVDLGHEIGYHYEDLSICNGDAEKAICHFKMQLDYFRNYYPVRTICMHGSPRSKFDSRKLWEQFDYHDFGIVGEPYFDVDFSKVFYLTDTGRRWDGFNVSIRDKVLSHQEEWIGKGWVYHSTGDILKALSEGTFPKQLMLTTHPQRWTDNLGLWLEECIMQSAKNVVKSYLVSRK